MVISDIRVGQGLVVDGKRLVRIPEEEFWVGCKLPMVKGKVPFAFTRPGTEITDFYLLTGNKLVEVATLNEY